MKETIIRQNPWWREKVKEDSIPRPKYLNSIISNLSNKEIIFLTGLRRVGKTTLIKQTINHLIKENTESKNILFLTLDDLNFTGKTIFEIINEYREINGLRLDDFFYLFLDEITYLDNFEQQLKNLYDTYNIKIIASSSIATLLRNKKAFLTGRTITVEVMPLDFNEFLIFRGIKADKNDPAFLKKHFEEYMKIGGIPRYVLDNSADYIVELVNAIIYKDIIAQYQISDEKSVKELFRLLCQRIGKPTSYNKLSKILKISDTTIKKYISYFESAYLFYSVEKFSKSVNENITSPKKFYISDLGIKNIVSENKEKGSDFENLIFLKIKNKNPYYYLKEGIEIDFITKDMLIESKYLSSIEGKQKILFDNIKRKNKIVVRDYSFLMD